MGVAPHINVMWVAPHITVIGLAPPNSECGRRRPGDASGGRRHAAVAGAPEREGYEEQPAANKGTAQSGASRCVTRGVCGLRRRETDAPAYVEVLVRSAGNNIFRGRDAEHYFRDAEAIQTRTHVDKDEVVHG
jgi:hypothetical protein